MDEAQLASIGEFAQALSFDVSFLYRNVAAHWSRGGTGMPGSVKPLQSTRFDVRHYMPAGEEGKAGTASGPSDQAHNKAGPCSCLKLGCTCV